MSPSSSSRPFLRRRKMITLQSSDGVPFTVPERIAFHLPAIAASYSIYSRRPLLVDADCSSLDFALRFYAAHFRPSAFDRRELESMPIGSLRRLERAAENLEMEDLREIVRRRMSEIAEIAEIEIVAERSDE